MRGRVEMINQLKGFIAVKTENNDYSVVEVIDSYFPELGAIVLGALNGLGGETLRCLDNQIEFEVFIQEIYSDYTNAKRMLSMY